MRASVMTTTRPTCPPSRGTRGAAPPTPSAFVSALLTPSVVPAPPNNSTQHSASPPAPPAVDRQAVGGVVGLLRSRDTGNSPSRERQATPMSSSYKEPLTSNQPSTSNHAGTSGFPLFPPPRTAVFGPNGRRGIYRGLAHTSVDTALSGANAASSLATMAQSLIPPLFVPPIPMGEDALADAPPRPPRPAVTVVFDLDETLCNNRRPGKALLRPHTFELLHHLHALRNDPHANCYVELVLWTASMECVARPVVDRIDPTGTLFQHCIYRDRRWYKEQGYTKDLRKLGREMHYTVIIENSPASVHMNRKHSILVKDFVTGQDSDLVVVRDLLDGWVKRCGETARQMNAPLPNEPESPTSIVKFLGDRSELNHGNEIVVRPPPSFVAKLQKQVHDSKGDSLRLGSRDGMQNPMAITRLGGTGSIARGVGGGTFRSSYSGSR